MKYKKAKMKIVTNGGDKLEVDALDTGKGLFIHKDVVGSSSCWKVSHTNTGYSMYYPSEPNRLKDVKNVVDEFLSLPVDWVNLTLKDVKKLPSITISLIMDIRARGGK